MVILVVISYYTVYLHTIFYMCIVIHPPTYSINISSWYDKITNYALIFNICIFPYDLLLSLLKINH